jgi:hypothetical protein
LGVPVREPGKKVSGVNGMKLTSVVVTAGSFTTAGGLTANHITQWDGSSWSPLGNSLNDSETALAEYNGELVVGGTFSLAGDQVSAYLARWGPPGPPADFDCDLDVDAGDLQTPDPFLSHRSRPSDTE